MLKTTISFYFKYKWFTRAFLSFMHQFLFYKWLPFLKNTRSQDVDIYFYIFTWVRKRFYKKENEKLWESRDRIKNCDKKDAIQSNDESIQFYEGDQKSLQEKIQKLNEKQQDFAIKWKNICSQ